MASLTSGTNATSFQKKGKSRIPFIRGTRPSVQNAQILTSCGVPSLDHIVGGGLPVGSIFLIEEDKYGTFGKLLLKYFLAEGAVNGHALFLASRDINPNSLIKELPKPSYVEGGSDTQQKSIPSDDSMSIAWRYQNMPQVQSVPGGVSGGSSAQLGHNFDLTQTMSQEEIERCNLSTWSGSQEVGSPIGKFMNPDYSGLLRAVQQRIMQGQFRIDDEPEKPNTLRLALHSIGSPLWISTNCNDLTDIHRDVPRFLFLLRSLLRDSYATAVVTVPSHLFQDPAIVQLCEYHSDMALRLESFAGSAYETNPAFKEYHGLLHVKKLGSVNTLATHVPESMDLAFKLRRKKFVIEKLHLPPELQESSQREQDDVAPGATPTAVGCGSGRSNKLDF